MPDSGYIRTYSFFMALMLGLSSTAHADPDRWEKSSDGLSNIYRISDANKNTFTLTCTTLHDDTDVLLHHVTATSPAGEVWDSLDEATNVGIYVDGKQYPTSHYLGWRYGETTWVEFIKTLMKSETFEVYTDDKKFAAFSPSATNVRRTLRGLDECIALRTRDLE